MDISEFWRERSRYIALAFDTTPEEYQDYVVKELSRLCGTNEETCCWFEFDLFYQANLNYINKFVEHSAISIVQPYPGQGYIYIEKVSEIWTPRQLPDCSFQSLKKSSRLTCSDFL